MFRETVNWIKSMYMPPSAESLALRELDESKRRLLEAQTAREYADSMCKFHEVKIKRLTTYLHTATEAKQ